MHPAAVQRVVEALGEDSIGAFLAALLSNPAYSDSPVRQQFVSECTQLLTFFCSLSYLSPTITTFCLDYVINLLTSEVRELVKKQTGWHFSARNAKAEPILGFSLSDMADKLEERAPSLWRVLSALLASDPVHVRRRAQAPETCKSGASGSGPDGSGSAEWDEEDDYWLQLERLEEGVQGERREVNEQGERPSKRRRLAGLRNLAQNRIVSSSASRNLCLETCTDLRPTENGHHDVNHND